MEKIFKAKRLDNGEWLEFDFIDIAGTYASGRVEILTKDCTETITVLLDTICQYTGIDDSEGNRIFEGDEFTDCTYAKMYKGSFVVDCGDDVFCLYDEAGNLTLSGRNIHDKG